MKILFCATYPDQPIGYGRIANIVSNRLAEIPGVELHYFGYSNFESTKQDRYIHPNIKFIDAIKEEGTKEGEQEMFGTQIIDKFMDKIKPDVLFIYNDILVTGRLFNSLLDYKKRSNHKYKVVVYIDLVYDFEKWEYINFLDKQADLVFVFSDYWKENLRKMNFDISKVRVFPHGLDEKIFVPVDKREARKRLGLKEDDFIIMNTNRNSYRKMWDITIKAFLTFLKRYNCNPKFKLFINCHLNIKWGYDIPDLIKTECVKQDLDYNFVTTNCIIHLPKTGFIEDSTINLMYNAADIGVNSCCGEGFGLCNLEGAGVGVAQVITNTGGLTDIFKNGNCIRIYPKCTITASNHHDVHNGDLHICDSNDFADAFCFYYENTEKRIQDGKNAMEDIRRRFQWKPLLDNFAKDFCDFFGINDDTNPKIIFDIGTKNDSSYTRKYNEIVHIFEPNMSSFKQLKELYKNNDNVITNCMGIGSENKLGRYDERIEKFSNENGYIQKITKLSTYMEKKNIKYIDLLKIDINDDEIQILKGLEDKITNVGLFEIKVSSPKEELLDFLSNKGLSQFAYKNDILSIINNNYK